MNFCSVASKDEKIGIKTFLGILSFVCIIFLLPGQIAAQAAQFKTAFIRASDNKVYQIYYKKPLSLEDFLVRSSNGQTVPRDVTAELYVTAEF